MGLLGEKVEVVFFDVTTLSFASDNVKRLLKSSTKTSDLKFRGQTPLYTRYEEHCPLSIPVLNSPERRLSKSVLHFKVD